MNIESTSTHKLTINDILDQIRNLSTNEKWKGTEFERLMKRWFLTDPKYNILDKVWLWEEFPGRSDFGGIDPGIDLVAHTELGDYWAIQCKFYKEGTTIGKPLVDKLLSNAGRTFIEDETGETRQFSRFVWVDTQRKKWGPNAERTIKNRSDFFRINLVDLENSSVDWHKLVHGEQGKEAQLKAKTPLPHQQIAIQKAHKYYIGENNERGKLIMACGTGKTYTSLKIMEDLTNKDALVLFLVPSIALLGQTLNAWMSDRVDNILPICVCSDSKVSQKMIEADEEDMSTTELAYPASTNTKTIIRNYKKLRQKQGRVVIFSTYQSIDVVSDFLHEANLTVDLCICDEAHRTASYNIKGLKFSNFTKVHKNEIIPARKRLYMTATPKLYKESVKVKVSQNEDVELCSMDDEKIYGKEFHRLSFNEAVSKGLLTDYKVLVLTVSEADIPKTIKKKIKEAYNNAETDKDKLHELNFDDATKLIGCINGLSKRIKGDNGITLQQDPIKMKRAVAFCQTINPTKSNPSASSTQIATYFSTVCDAYKHSLSDGDKVNVVNIKAQHIDGSMDANTRNEKLAWLKADADDPDECRVLCNVRCLSEGVDVPALDAVLFLSPRNSEVEVVQSVGRVMRSFGRGTDHEKKYGYIIIPVIVPENVKPEDALNDNERFKVVWTILNALRSHDENFNAHVNQICLNKRRDPKIMVGGVPNGSYSLGKKPADDGEAVTLDNSQIAKELELRFGELQDGIYARIVEKVGDKMYWENWSKEIGQIAIKFIERINHLVDENTAAKKTFKSYLKGLQNNINPTVDREQGIEMLAQHMITKPIFDALFKEYEFVKNNAVSRSMQGMIEILQKEGFEMDTEVLDKFYTSVKNNVSSIDNLEGKQTIIKNIYEKFFKGAFPKTVDKLGIVYTPVECVDYIIRSVDAILHKEFDTALTNENVNILDPFTGTGTFIVRLLQLGVIKPEDMQRKYLHEIFCNEIVLLAYYIADVNIESAFQALMKSDNYLPFNGICLTDTFQITENTVETNWEDNTLEENFKRMKKLRNTPIQVICSNPPYSVGQKSANDNAQNTQYARLEERIEGTYVKYTSASLTKSLYDSYVKAIRWATDRIAHNENGGIIAFMTPNSWIDGNAQEGMRVMFEKEFSSIYILNLRGNGHTSGERCRQEGEPLFAAHGGQGGSLSGICITILVMNPNATDKHIYYHDIGMYLKRSEKLQKVKNDGSILNTEWQEIRPNDKHDWINQRDDLFDTLITITPQKKFSEKSLSFFSTNVIGVSTNRDPWNYNFSTSEVSSNMERMISFYNYQRIGKNNGNISEYSTDDTKIKWTRALRKLADNNVNLSFDKKYLALSSYRPFCNQSLYYDRALVESPGVWDRIFPLHETKNLVICFSNAKTPTVLVTNNIPNLHYIGDTQCFPLYWFEENKHKQLSLFDDPNSDDNYIRHDGISDWILSETRKRYHAHNITKEHIFYYVYGILHSEDYRTRFAADLKKSLPRIPLVEKLDDFLAFSQAGRKLAQLHLNYETVPPCPDVVLDGDKPLTNTDADYDFYRIPDKMRFKSKADKSTIFYNGNIAIKNIPEKAYEYIVNGKSAIEWIVERYCVSVDKASHIKNDCNDWAKEHNKPRYVLDLLLSVINVSVQSVDVINNLPHLKFD